jgi:hypothetical protein
MSTGDHHLGKIELQPGYESSANRSIISIAGTLDAIMVQLTRIADALTQATPAAEPEEMVDVHGNPVPLSTVKAIREYLERAHQSGITVTAAWLCRNFSQSPATMQHMIDDYAKEVTPKTDDGQKCPHPFRRVTGTRIECLDCGAVIGDEGTPILKTITPEQAAADSGMELDPPDPPYRYETIAQQLEKSQQRCRDLEERLVTINRQLTQAKHSKSLGGDDEPAN